jgi:hypothetical protein
MSFAVLEPPLAALAARLGELLSAERRGWYAEFLGVGEYELALEMLADWLSEDETPLPVDARSEALSLASEMGVHDRVAGALALCPSEPA